MNFSGKLSISLLLLMPMGLLTGQSPTAKIQFKPQFSIGQGERPITGQSSILLSPIGSNVTVLTEDGDGSIYVYTNGNKSGPFRDLKDTKVKMPDDNPAEYDPVLRRESDPDYEKYLKYSDAGEITLTFAGKSYGPLQSVLEFYSTKDKTGFSALVMQNGKPEIITSTGSKYDLDGQPTFSYASSSGNKMMVTIVKDNEPAAGSKPVDNVKPSSKEIPGAVSKTESKQPNHPEAYILFQDGKRYGPYYPGKINANNPSFNKTGGDNWLLTMDSKLYINGTFARKLVNEYISPANVWLTEDGKRYAILVYNRIEFSDGSIYYDPLKIRISVDKNKITIWWLSLENRKDIVLYSKTI
jgi:hypothetical protein